MDTERDIREKYGGVSLMVSSDGSKETFVSTTYGFDIRITGNGVITITCRETGKSKIVFGDRMIRLCDGRWFVDDRILDLEDLQEERNMW